VEISLSDYPTEKSKIINIVEGIMIDHSDIFNDEHQAFHFFSANLFANSSKINESFLSLMVRLIKG